jgi:hypothetical protein
MSPVTIVNYGENPNLDKQEPYSKRSIQYFSMAAWMPPVGLWYMDIPSAQQRFLLLFISEK